MEQHKITGGEAVARSLRRHGVEVVFCVPGESYLDILDALYDLGDEITVVQCRHEHGAANMAEAYGKLTGKAGVCLVTRGPGACNATIGIHTAFQDSTPLVLLIGQVARPHLGREAFQEVDYRKMFAPLAKEADQVDRADEIPEMMNRAFHTALSGRPGPVVLAFPEDILGEEISSSDPEPLEITPFRPDPASMERLGDMLNEAVRPVMMVGGGGWTARAREDIAAFAGAFDLPVCCSFRRHDLFDNRDPNFIGEMGIGPNPALPERVKEADLLVCVGARLGEMTTQGYTLLEGAQGLKLVHVYADKVELGRVYPPDLAIHSGMAEFSFAARNLKPKNKGRWQDWALAARRDYEEGRVPPDFEGELDLSAVMAWLDTRLPNDAVVTVAAGNFSGWPQRYLSFGPARRLLGPTSGAMGYGVPAAVAAKCADPGRTVLCCVGDGGFGMTGQEIATAVLMGLAPLILVFNNAMYGTIRMHQERRYPGRVVGTGLANPDFAELARSYGAHGERVIRTEDFAPAFERALASGKAALIELTMDPDVITTRTTLSAIRAASEKETS